MPRETPYISFVTYARNDDYAGGRSKLYWSVRYLAEQCDDFGLSAELVLVDWNPPRDQPALAQFIADIPPSSRLALRVITVPGTVHVRFKHHELRPIHAGVAANVGIRRARGDYVLLKMADVFYPDALIRYLAGRPLFSDRLYRTERWDVAPDTASHLGEPRGTFLEQCALGVVARHGHLPQPWMPFSLPDLFGNASGDFQLLSRAQWSRLRGYFETSDVLSFEADSMLSYAAYAAGIREERIPEGLPVYKIAHGQSHDHRISVGSDSRSRFLPRLEALFNRIKYLRPLTFAMRVLFNYPTKRYSGVRKPVYERSLIRFKALSLFPALNLLKSRDWGLAGEALEEQEIAARPNGA